MVDKLSQLVDRASEFFAKRKGLLPLLGILFVILNFLLQIIPLGWISTSQLLLHIGVILAILGFMLAWAL